MRATRNHVLWATTLFLAGASLLSGCGSDTSTNPTPPPAADVTITIQANNGGASFNPNPANVTVGQTVAWQNSATDNNVHTATAAGSFNTGNIAFGATSSPITMGTTGAFNYACSIHPGMTGTLNVTPTAPDLTIMIVANNGNLSFDPNPAVVTVGQTVAWMNMSSDNMVHTATSDVPGEFDTGSILVSATSAKITMSKAGSFPYHCTPHSAMTGTVTVNP